MLSFYNLDFSKNKIFRKEKNTLQVHPFYINDCISKRKASFFASFIKIKSEAFLTVEVSFVLPVFVCVFCAFLWFFNVFKTQMILQDALRDISYELSEYAFLYEEIRNFSNDEAERVSLEEKGLERWITGGITESYVESRIKDRVGQNNSIFKYVKDGYKGLDIKSFLRIPDDNGMIDLVLVYEMNNPFLPRAFSENKYIQRSCVRAWTGYGHTVSGDTEEEQTVVYITEYGTVYHIIRDCTHIKLSIKGIPYIQVPVIYNQKIYTECHICMMGDGETIYITETGERYHWHLSCSGLRRTVYEVPIEDAVGYAPCSRCGKDLKE